MAICTNTHYGRNYFNHLEQIQACVILDISQYVAFREVLEEFFGAEITDEMKLRSGLLFRRWIVFTSRGKT